MKTVLYFFPLNLMKNNTGSIRRAWGLLESFKSAGCVVDYAYSFDLWGGPMEKEETEAIKRTGLVREVYELRKKPAGSNGFKYTVQYRIRRLLKDIAFRRSIPDFVTAYNQHIFNTILEKNTYDYIVISYAYWFRLIKNNPYTKQAKLIIDTHDFLTAQELGKSRFSVGKGFADEMQRLNYFDQVWAISAEEQYLFQQFTNKKVGLIPFCTDDHTEAATVPLYDVVYVAGDNVHNVKAAEWFFKSVYPLLPQTIRYCVIGAIHTHVPIGPNIYKVPYAPDLGEYYSRTKVAICPMLSGTGVKIKVIEALSYGLPVVCSARGIDGLVNKTDNGCVVAESAEDFAEAIRKLLNNTNHYLQVKEQGKHFFRENHSQEHFVKMLARTL